MGDDRDLDLPRLCRTEGRRRWAAEQCGPCGYESTLDHEVAATQSVPLELLDRVVLTHVWLSFRFAFG